MTTYASLYFLAAYIQPLMLREHNIQLWIACVSVIHNYIYLYITQRVRVIHLPDTLSVIEHINERSSVCHSRMRFISTLAALMTLQSSLDPQHSVYIYIYSLSYKIIISTTYIFVTMDFLIPVYIYILSLYACLFLLTVYISIELPTNFYENQLFLVPKDKHLKF